MTFYVQRRDSIYAFLLLLGNHLLLHAHHLGVGQVGIYIQIGENNVLQLGTDGVFENR